MTPRRDMVLGLFLIERYAAMEINDIIRMLHSKSMRKSKKSTGYAKSTHDTVRIVEWSFSIHSTHLYVLLLFTFRRPDFISVGDRCAAQYKVRTDNH